MKIRMISWNVKGLHGPSKQLRVKNIKGSGSVMSLFARN